LPGRFRRTALQAHDHDEQNVAPNLEQQPVQERLMLVEREHRLHQRVARRRKMGMGEDFLCGMMGG
jgi:hypothetical protein